MRLLDLPLQGDALSHEAVNNGLEKIIISEYNESDYTEGDGPADILRSWLERQKAWVHRTKRAKCSVRDVAPKFMGMILGPFNCTQ